MNCKDCGRPITPTEIGLYKKMINRGATDASCITCLAKFFGCTEQLLREKIHQFRRSGCALFSDDPE